MKSLRLDRWNTAIRWCELPGKGAPIVCLPGLSTAAVPNFLPLMTRPEFRGRRVLMIDYLGSGLSGHPSNFGYSLDEHAESIAAILDEENIGSAPLLGYSMGGSVGIALALSRPDLVSRLIVCEGNLTPGGGEASRAIAATDLQEFVSTAYPQKVRELTQAAANGSAIADFLSAAQHGLDPKGLHGNARALVHLPAGFQGRFLTAPRERHFVYGEKTFPGTTGQVTPDAPDPDLLSANGVGIHVVPGVGHALMIEDPVATADVLRRLL